MQENAKKKIKKKETLQQLGTGGDIRWQFSLCLYPPYLLIENPSFYQPYFLLRLTMNLPRHFVHLMINLHHLQFMEFNRKIHLKANIGRFPYPTSKYLGIHILNKFP